MGHPYISNAFHVISTAEGNGERRPWQNKALAIRASPHTLPPAVFGCKRPWHLFTARVS